MRRQNVTSLTTFRSLGGTPLLLLLLILIVPTKRYSPAAARPPTTTSTFQTLVSGCCASPPRLSLSVWWWSMEPCHDVNYYFRQVYYNNPATFYGRLEILLSLFVLDRQRALKDRWTCSCPGNLHGWAITGFGLKDCQCSEYAIKNNCPNWAAQCFALSRADDRIRWETACVLQFVDPRKTDRGPVAVNYGITNCLMKCSKMVTQ